MSALALSKCAKRALFLTTSLAITIAGCGGPEAKAPKPLVVPNHFPTKSALEKVAAAPVKARPARDVVSIPEWRIDSSDLPDGSIAETSVGEVGDRLHFSRELRCVARELGRFRADHGGESDERLQRFIAGACGLTGTGGIGSYYVKGEVPAKISDAELFEQWKKQLQVPPSFKGKTAGAWLSRKGNQAILTVVAGQPETAATVTPGSTPGTAIVRGNVTGDVESVLALVNQGRDGVARCEPDRTVALPQYAFACTMRDDDPWAWIEVGTRAPGRLLMRSAALVLARRDPQAVVELVRAASPASQGTTEDQIVAAVLDGVNRTRASAKLGPVKLAPKQSSVNTRLAAHFFDVDTQADEQTSDLVALGLLAGWDVDGMIRNGDFFGTMLTGAKDGSSWIDYALEHPMGRFTLLQPEAREIAIGPAPIASSGGIGVVVTTYALFGAEDHQADAARVMGRLAEERTARRLPAIAPLGNLPTLVNEARLVHAGQREPMAALDRALNAETERLGQSMRGWVVVTHDLDNIPFPKELLAPGPAAVRVVVTHYKPEGFPWGAYLVYFVVPAPTQQQLASTGSHSVL